LALSVIVVQQAVPRELIERLRSLLAAASDQPGQGVRWASELASFMAWADENPSVVPEVAWHFASDQDIRSRDEEYGRAQKAALVEWIESGS